MAVKEDEGVAVEPRYIRIKEAEARYSLSRATWNRALNDGGLTRYKRGRAVLLSVAEIESWIADCAA